MSALKNTEKIEMVKRMVPETVESISFVKIDLDITDLSIADILRNIDKTFPKNSRDRNMIASARMVVAVLCKSTLLRPLDGLILIISDNGARIQIESKNYIVVSVSEDTISDKNKIMDMLDRFTTYLIHNYGEKVESFKDFYMKYIFDDYELDDMD